jgi:hypothetical protein
LRNWKINPLGVLESLSEQRVGSAIDFVLARRRDILKVVAGSWGVVLLMVFTLIVTIRLALL